jgi:16S rRNA (cytidine1402-2'-O)-methyltransferase
MSKTGIVYLVPSVLDERGIEAIPSSVLGAVKNCQVFFVENERTARRYLKLLWKEIVIDNYQWFTINNTSDMVTLSETFRQKLTEGKNVGIISEAGCPGVADPGQSLVTIAHDINAQVKPLAGPSSILLALMASGMNGQQFQFVGYLPINNQERATSIRELEVESNKKDCTQIFIETPYRNNQLVEALLQNCKPTTRLCIAVELTSPEETVKTKTISQWRQNKPEINKHPAVFLLYAAT